MIDFTAFLLSQVKNMTEPEIINTAEKLKVAFRNEITEEQYQEALKIATENIKIRIEPSFLVQSEDEFKDWFNDYYKELGHTRWDRYKDFLLYRKQLPNKVINQMEKNLFKIVNLLGNPNGGSFQRKGMVVGDVQSGKTANFIGLMNLAADVNYDIAIVLTGTTNTLREQTQIRVEEGLGSKSQPEGVISENPATYNFINPEYKTSIKYDFKDITKEISKGDLKSYKSMVVLVTKKNVFSLNNIYEWLVNYSKNKNDELINSSILMIDDEADFASVNTKESDDPTKINQSIRKILNLFTKSSYVGFTATPFANVFINPDSENEMCKQDLFPKDYIFVLGESEDYVGVQSVFGEESAYENMIVPLNIEEEEKYLKLKHKKNDDLKELSPSLKKAINMFFLSNAILDIRKTNLKHRSMLINMSRFISMHEQVETEVTTYINRLKTDIRLYSKLPIEESIKIKSISDLKETFDTTYAADLSENIYFENILYVINDSVSEIHAEVVNGRTNNLNYNANEDGERVIVIGGFALSRGLTLEGLIISYYYRNSVMYDSLLQMGRWFGYRSKYADLCRIFMTDKAINDYSFIANATKELKEDLELNSKRKLTPKQFGIKIRTGQTGLIITARNKMKCSGYIKTSADFSNEIVESVTFNTKNTKYNEENKKLIINLIEENKEKLSNNISPRKSNAIGLVDIDKHQIIAFLNKWMVESVGSHFDVNLINRWLQKNKLEALDKWDVAFISGESSKEFDFGNGIKGTGSKRTVIQVDEKEQRYKLSKARLGSPSDGQYGLTTEQINLVKKIKEEGNTTISTISQKNYLMKELNRKPLMLIYSVSPNFETNIDNSFDDLIYLISVSIPDLGVEKTVAEEYIINKVYNDLNDDEIECEEE